MSQKDTPVKSDPNLEPEERETAINWSQRDDRAKIFSEEPALVRRVLRNPAFEPERARVIEGCVVAVAGTLPMGGVRLKAKPAKTDRHSKVHSRSGLEDDALDRRVEQAIESGPGWVTFGG